MINIKIDEDKQLYIMVNNYCPLQHQGTLLKMVKGKSVTATQRAEIELLRDPKSHVLPRHRKKVQVAGIYVLKRAGMRKRRIWTEQKEAVA